MLDIQFIRAHPDRVKTAARNKGVEVDLERLLRLDAERRGLQQQVDALSERRRLIARTLAPEANQGGKRKERGRIVKKELAPLEEKLRQVHEEYLELLARVPNLPSEDTPVGPDAGANRVLRSFGTKPAFSFPPKEHWELGVALGLIDTERAVRVAGSRFAYLQGDLVLLQFALIQHALAVLTDRARLEPIIAAARLTLPATPFIPVIPPVLAKPITLQNMARLEPKEERYYLPADDLYLVGSAEHTLGSLHQREIFREDDLPRRYVGFSTCFRREAGSYGKDVHGILRLHQFDKLEMESFTLPEQGRDEQEFLVALQEHLMQSLQIPYQVVLLSTGDMGAPDARQIDLEAWFPGQQYYRETHSADYLTDYQARRLHTKVRRRSAITEFVHMNDATVFAIGRTLAALLEVYQRADGSIEIPSVLRPLVGGRDRLQAVKAPDQQRP